MRKQSLCYGYEKNVDKCERKQSLCYGYEKNVDKDAKAIALLWL